MVRAPPPRPPALSVGLRPQEVAPEQALVAKEALSGRASPPRPLSSVAASGGGDAAAPPLGETADAGDVAAPRALPAAALAAASAAAVAEAEMATIDNALVVQRKATRASADLALRSLALESTSRRSFSFLRHCSASPVSRTSLAFQTFMSARSMAVSERT